MRSLTIPALSFILIVLSAFISYENSIKNLAIESNRLFHYETDKYFNAVEKNIGSSLKAAESVVALFYASNEVSRDEFKIFTNKVLENHAEIQALNWVIPVNKNQRRDYEVRLQKQGFTNFIIHNGYNGNKLRPTIDREWYYPIHYTEPFNINKKAFGFDVMANYSSQLAIEDAINSQKITISEPLILVQDDSQQVGVVFLLPVVKDGSFQGCVQLALRMEYVINYVQQKIESQEIILSRIMDINSNKNLKIIDNSATIFNSGSYNFFHEKIWDIAGRQWKFEFYPSAKFIDKCEKKKTEIQENLLFSVALASCIFFFLFFTIQQRKKSEQSRLLLKDSQRSLVNQQHALDEHAIVSITDAKGRITYANEKFEKISQYSQNELLGKDHRLINSGLHPQEFFRQMKETIRAGNSWQGQIHNKAKDGSFYWVQSTIIPFLNDQLEPEKYISIRTDITELKKLEQKRYIERQHARFRVTISQVLQKQLELKERFEAVLSILCEFDEMQMQNKAGVFLLDKDKLNMFAMHGQFSDEFILKEDCIDAGACLCGRVAISGMLKISNDCFTDHEHEHQFDGMVAHGHYIIPLKYADKVLGILFLYTDPYPSREPIILEMLSNIGAMMGLAISNDYAHKDLIQEKLVSDKANKAKSEFLSSMSHELRTPLNAILGFAQLLATDDQAPLTVDQKEGVDYIISGGDHLLTLINDVLELSAIEAGKTDVKLENSNLNEVIQGCMLLVKNIAKKQGITLTIDHCDNDLLIFVDPTKLRQILLNLINNAIKYNRNNGTVIVSWHITDTDNVRIKIVDTGIGISVKNSQKVFIAFERLGQEGTNIEGTGIGLSVTKQLVELMGGTIGFDSVESQGSTFWLEFPRIKSISETRSIGKLAIEQENRGIISNSTVPKKILYVEDNAANRKLMRRFFEKQKEFDFYFSESGEQGWAMINEQHFDLILMDRSLPDVSGDIITQRIKSSSMYRKIPVLAVSANAMVHDIEETKDLFDAYILKPINFSILEETLLKHL